MKNEKCSKAFQVVQHCEQPLLTDYVQRAFNSPSEQEMS